MAIRLSGRTIGPGNPLFIIAEAGVNHNGSLKLALDLVDVAADAGADAIKFQTFRADKIITRVAPKALYHIETTGPDEKQSWFELLKTQELDRAAHETLIARCAKRSIMFLSTPYDVDSVDLLDELGVALFKIASTDANNTPFLKYVAAKSRPMILSTAMCSLDEVKASVAAIRAAGIQDLVVMQCTGSYPAPAQDANLHAMAAIAEACNVSVGYSDHVPGFNAAIAATALGACCYEKHFTLDRSLPGPDHRASLEPDELKTLIAALRETEVLLGDGVKRVMPCEIENRGRLRKSLLAARDLPAGHIFRDGDVVVKRAGGKGLSPDRLDAIIGRRLSVPLGREHPIEETDLEQSDR